MSDWKPREDICEECGLNPYSGVQRIGKHEIKLCNEYREKLFGKKNNKQPKQITVINKSIKPVKCRTIPIKGKPKNLTHKAWKKYKQKLMDAATIFVKSQKGQFISYSEFVNEFPDLAGPKGVLSLGKYKDSKLRIIGMTCRGIHKYVVYDYPGNSHGSKVVYSDFERIISDRLGEDWYLPASKSRPNPQEVIGKALNRQLEKEKADRIEPPPETIDGIEIDPSMKKYTLLIHDIVYRLTTSQLLVTYNMSDLRKLANVKNYQEFGVAISALGSYLPAISGFCGFTVKMRSLRGYSVIFRKEL